VRQVRGDPLQVEIGPCGECGVKAFLELVEGQPTVSVVLAQLAGQRLTIGVADSQA